MDQETQDEERYGPIQHVLRNLGGEWITLYTHAEDENGQLVVDRFNLYVCGPQPPAVIPSSQSRQTSPPPPTLYEPVLGQSAASLPDFLTPPTRIVPVVQPGLSSINLPPYNRSPPHQPWPDTPVPWTPDAIPQSPPSLTAAPTELRPGDLTYSQRRHLEWWLRQTQTDPPRHPNRISPLHRQQFCLPVQREQHHHRNDRDDSCARTGLHRAVRDYQVSLNERGKLRGGARWGRDESPEREREQDERDIRAAVWYGQRAEAEILRREEMRAGAVQRGSFDAFLMPPTPPASPPWSAAVPAPPPSPARPASPLSSSRTRSSQTADKPSHLSSLRPTRYERPSALNIPSASDFIPPAIPFHIPSSQVNEIMERFGPPTARRDGVYPTAARSRRRDEIRRTRIRQALYSPSEYSQPSPEGLQGSNSSTSDPTSDSESDSDESWATPAMVRSPASSTASTVVASRMRSSTPSLAISRRLIPRSPSLPVSPVSRLSRGLDYIPSRDPFLTPMVSPLVPTIMPSSFRSSRPDDSPVRSSGSFENPFRSPYQTNGNPFIDSHNGGVVNESSAGSYHLNYNEDTQSFASIDDTIYSDDINGTETTPLNTDYLPGFPASIRGHETRHADNIYHDPLPPQYTPTRTDASNRTHTRNHNLNYTPALIRHLSAPRTSPTSPTSPTASTILRNPFHPPPTQPFPAEDREHGDDAEEGRYQDTDEEIFQQILAEDLDLSVLDEDDIRWLRGRMDRERERERQWPRQQRGDRGWDRDWDVDEDADEDTDEDAVEDEDEPRWLTETINRNRALIRDWDVTDNRGAVRAGDGHWESPRLGAVNGDAEGRLSVVNRDVFVDGDGLVNGDALVDDRVNRPPPREDLQWELRNGSVHDGHSERDGRRDGESQMANRDNHVNGVRGNRADGVHGLNGFHGVNIPNINGENIPNINDEYHTNNYSPYDTALPRLTRHPTLPRQPTPQHPTLPRHHRRGGLIRHLPPQEPMDTPTNGLRIGGDDVDGGMMARNGMRARDRSGGIGVGDGMRVRDGSSWNGVLTGGRGANGGRGVNGGDGGDDGNEDDVD